MSKYEFGDVVLAYIWCDEGKGKKLRPCLVLETVGSRAFEVAPMTSQQAFLGGKMSHEVIIMCDQERKTMGLKRDSRISLKMQDLRITKESDIKRKIGTSTRNVLMRCAFALKNA